MSEPSAIEKVFGLLDSYKAQGFLTAQGVEIDTLAKEEFYQLCTDNTRLQKELEEAQASMKLSIVLESSGPLDLYLATHPQEIPPGV